MLDQDSDYFLELQTRTGWGRTLFSFAEWCNPQPGWRVLDVGCGPGLLPAIFAHMGCRVAGMDIDPEMFRPTRLHAEVVIADVKHLPFIAHRFDLITATNLLFLMPSPVLVLSELKWFLQPSAKFAMLNPSENLTEQGAVSFAEKRGLEALARDTLVNWARRAEANFRWTEEETRELFAGAGMRYMASEIKIGPGFGRFSWATT